MNDIEQTNSPRRRGVGFWAAILFAVVLPLAIIVWVAVDEPVAPVNDLSGSLTDASGVANAIGAPGPQPVRRELGPLAPTVSAAQGVADLTVTVVFDNGAPGEGVEVLLRRYGESAALHAKRCIADTDGVAHFGRVRPGQFKVWTNRNLATTTEFREILGNQVVSWTLVIPAVTRVSGRVVNGSNDPVAGAELISAPMGTIGEDACTVGWTKNDGTFELVSSLNPLLIGARAHWYGPSRMHYLVSDEGGAFDVTIRLTEAGGSVEGTVRGPGGTPIAGAVVRAGTGRMDAIEVVGRSGPALPGQVITDESGHFRVVGVPVGTAQLVVRASTYASVTTSCLIAHGVVTAADIVLTPGAVVEGLVRDEAGQLLAHAVVSVGEEGELTYTRDVTDKTGFYRLSGLTPGDVQLDCRQSLVGTVVSNVHAIEGRTVNADLVVVSGRVIEGRVLVDGEPVVTADVSVQAMGRDSDWNRMVWSGTEGEFVFINVADGDIRLRVKDPSIETSELIVTMDQTESIVWEVTGREIASGAIVGEVVDYGGDPVQHATVFLNRLDVSDEDVESDSALTRESDGGFGFGELPDGYYELRVMLDGFAPTRQGDIQVQDGQMTDIGTLVALAGHEITVEVEGYKTIPGLRGGAVVILSDSNLEFLDSQPVEDTVPPMFNVPAGDYWFELRGAGLANRVLRASIQAPSKITMRAVSGISAKVRFAGTDKLASVEEGLLEIRSADGVAVRRRLKCGPGCLDQFSTRLAVGDYEVSFDLAKGGQSQSWSILDGAVNPVLQVVVR